MQKHRPSTKGNLIFILSLLKIIEFFGFVLYPEILFDDCIPNKLFKNRESGLPFPVFSERMYEKWEMFKISAGVFVHIVYFLPGHVINMNNELFYPQLQNPNK